MPVEYFVRYKGKCYDVGTRLKFKTSKWCEGLEGTIEWISHNVFYVRLIDGSGRQLSKMYSLDNTIIEIIEPVYYEEKPQEIDNRVYPSMGDIDIGWVWYILVMIVGVIFNARLLIWIVATVVFFSWKNGLFNGGKNNERKN